MTTWSPPHPRLKSGDELTVHVEQGQAAEDGSRSKAGLLRFTECVSDTLVGTGVLIFAMDPGLVRTAMTELQLQSGPVGNI